MAIATRRKSKYVEAVRVLLRDRGHATNGDLAEVLRETYHALSDTTVHRITQRLLRDGEIALAPVTASGAMRFDANLMPHDHFECQHCERLKDINVSTSIRDGLARELGDCEVSGPLTILGNCHKCINK